jgi:hypothetical protein
MLDRYGPRQRPHALGRLIAGSVRPMGSSEQAYALRRLGRRRAAPFRG